MNNTKVNKKDKHFMALASENSSKNEEYYYHYEYYDNFLFCKREEIKKPENFYSSVIKKIFCKKNFYNDFSTVENQKLYSK